MLYFEVEPIYIGFDAEISVEFHEEYAVPAGLATETISAEIRATVSSETVLFTATTPERS